MRKIFAPVLAVALSAAFLGFASPANADFVSSCGIDISAGANCEMRVSGGCTASCEPINFTAQCDVGCNVSATVMCTTSCEASCNASCMVNPPTFDCKASCSADCDASCGATCTGSRDTDSCRSGCKASCGTKCDAKCSATPPSADCSAKCKASCSGSCEADVNMSCQVDCQTMLTGGCTTACTKPDGALFCDGQYVDVGDKLDQCVADLKKLFQIEVTGYAKGDAQCSGNTCTAEGEAGFSCAQSGTGAGESSNALGMLGAIAAFGLALSRRKNNRA